MLWSPNTQLHYPFQNTALDYSGNARNGTVNGSGVYATKPNGGRCLYFDGVGDYVKTPSFGLSGTVVVFAADARIKLQAGMNQPPIGDNAALSGGTVGFLYCYRAQNSDDLIWRYANGTTTTNATATGFFTNFDDIWVHLCVAADYAGKNAYFYRRGVLFATVSMTTPIFPSTDRVKYLGEYAPGHGSILTDGYLANVQLWTLATMPAAGQMLANVNRLMLGMNPIW